MQRRTRAQLEPAVDRSTKCPFLLRTFVHAGAAALPATDYADRKAEGEVEVHTWMDATLLDLADLVRHLRPETREGRSVLLMSLVSFDRGALAVTPLGQVGKTRRDSDLRTLRSFGVRVGDMLDIAYSA